MNSRMERYNSRENDVNNYADRPSRVSRNSSLYQDMKTNELSRVRNNDNIKVIENSGKTIDLEKIRKYITEANDQPKATRKSVGIQNEDINKNVLKEEIKVKNYDINSVIENAKRTREIDYDRERYKKLRNTQYDILSKLDMYDDKSELEEENLEDFNTDERDLIDLINTVTIHKGEVNLLDELMGGEGEETTDPILEEIEKNDFKEQIEEIKEREEVSAKPVLADLKDKTTKIDNSFYTNSMSFSKEDFEGFEELEKSVKKNNIFATILIAILFVFIIVTLVIMANYVFDLGLLK